MTDGIVRVACAWRDYSIALDLFGRDKTDANLRALVDAKNELVSATNASMLEAFKAYAPQVLARAESRRAKNSPSSVPDTSHGAMASGEANGRSTTADDGESARRRG